MAKPLLSKPIIEKYKENLKARAKKIFADFQTRPNLKVILVGDDPASQVYTQHKKKFCESIEADCEIVKLDKNINEYNFLKQVQAITEDSKVHGVIIQLPLPEKLKNIDVSTLVPQHKDVDGFHPFNIDALVRGREDKTHLACCTPKGIITLLNEYDIPLRSTRALVLGRSMIVGKPISLMLLNRDATVTIGHSQTQNLRELTKQSDLIISAVGKPKFLNANYFRADQDQVLIDVGMNRDENGKLCGDFDYDSVKNHVKAITPVPGGVGPMTVLTLVQNLLQASENALYQNKN